MKKLPNPMSPDVPMLLKESDKKKKDTRKVQLDSQDSDKDEEIIDDPEDTSFPVINTPAHAISSPSTVSTSKSPNPCTSESDKSNVSDNSDPWKYEYESYLNPDSDQDKPINTSSSASSPDLSQNDLKRLMTSSLYLSDALRKLQNL